MVNFTTGRTPQQPVSKRPVMKPNLASANTPETKTPSFFVPRLVRKYYSRIICKATAAANNPVDLQSQNLSLMTHILIFLIEGLFIKLCIS
jgi:hypothetical protein